MKSCEEISQLISEQQDHDLKYNQRLSVWTHLFYCRNCRKFRNQMNRLSEISKKFNRQD